MIIVSDTSPITNLIQIGQLDLLEKLYHAIVLPEMVYEELCEMDSQKGLIDAQSWITVERVTNQNRVIALQMHLDHGEAEAIALAEELHADLVVMDELKGRKIAQESGLKIIGLLGILIQAKQQKHLSKIKSHIDDLVRVGFRINPNLYRKVLEIVSEN